MFKTEKNYIVGPRLEREIQTTQQRESLLAQANA